MSASWLRQNASTRRVPGISTPRVPRRLCENLSLRQCGTIGAITAGKVIEVVGTTFGEEAWEDISRLVNKVRNEKYLF